MFGRISLLASVLILGACVIQTRAQEKPVDPQRPVAAASAEKQKVYYVKGVIKEIKIDGQTAVIQHEEIPGYMEAMTMPFKVKNPTELADLVPGQKVSFRLVVTDTEGWIEQVTAIGGAPLVVTPSIGSFRRVRDVEPLKAGDLMPDYHFTNQLAQPISLGQLRGQAFAFTFIFTRCPFPDFCPRMSGNFNTALKQLSTPGGPTNWHLLTLTFDVGYDTPEKLRAYAERYGADPAKWSFCTGAMIDIDAITEQFGLSFSRSPGQFNFDHNMRTVVVDAAGKVQRIFVGNTWKPEELVEELKKGATINK
jgi:protein SCO1/2